MAGGSRFAVFAALLANLAIAVLKLAAGLFSRSAAMLAEAAHSFSDVGNQILLLVGIRAAQKPPSPEHPFGTGKAAYFWPFMVAILLFGFAGLYSLSEGIEKLRDPHELHDIRLALGVLGVSFLIESVSLTLALRSARESAHARGVASIRQFLEENRDASLITVIVEDILALVSLPIAGLALLLARYAHEPRWDAVGSLAIGALLMAFAGFLGWEIKRLLVGRGLSRRDHETVFRILRAEFGEKSVTKVESVYFGPDTVLLAASVALDPRISMADSINALAGAERKLIEALPALRFVYLEPAHPEGTSSPAPAPAHAAHQGH